MWSERRLLWTFPLIVLWTSSAQWRRRISLSVFVPAPPLRLHRPHLLRRHFVDRLPLLLYLRLLRLDHRLRLRRPRGGCLRIGGGVEWRMQRAEVVTVRRRGRSVSSCSRRDARQSLWCLKFPVLATNIFRSCSLPLKVQAYSIAYRHCLQHPDVC